MHTAILFLVFNRPDVTQKVFEAIRKAQPPRLYIASDGPRNNQANEDEVCAEVRRISTDVDWPCELHTLFRNENLGCRVAVSSAIDWFFLNEEEGIILEDDCLPDTTFFYFCQELLEHYRSESSVGMISGDNFQSCNKNNSDSYYFSKYSHVWGWATWRDRWVEHYDVNISSWPDLQNKKILFDTFKNKKEAAYWQSIFERVYKGEIDTWDYQWFLTSLINDRLNVIPSVNLISNIGFSEYATHTTGSSDLANIPRNSINLPLSHPNDVFRNIKADKFTFRKYYMVSFYQRARAKITLLLRFFIGSN